MSLLTLAYAVLAGALFFAAALCAEAGLRRLVLPARWVWLAALVATLAVPLAGPASRWGSELARRGGDLDVEGLLATEVDSGPEASGGEPEVTALNVARPWLPAAWALLALMAVGSVAGGLARLGRRVRRWPRSRVGDEPVLVSPDFGPAVVGLLHGRTVLPRWALALPERELEMIVRHERAHRRAGDPRLLGLGVVLAALAPWNPALWLCLRGLREATEKDCDQRVLASGADRLAYARMLVSIRGRGLEPASIGRAPIPALVATPHSLERRLRAMWIQPSRRPAVAALLSAAALVVVACESPSPTVTRPEPTQGSVTEINTVEASGALIEVQGTPEAPDPLIVVDGEIHEGALSLLAPEDIERVEVLKGAAAVTLYGEAGSDGVVQITTKEAVGIDGAPAEEPVAGTVRIRARPSTGTFRVDPLPQGESGVLRDLDRMTGDGALVFVDGVEVQEGVPATLRPEEIDRVEVIKGAAAASQYGARAGRGVIRIHTKAGSGGGG